MHTTSQTRADYWDQVTAEVKAPHRSLRNQKVWQPRSGRRNEGLDCEVYAMHAARGLRLHMMTPAKWDQLEHELTQVDLFSAPVVDEKPEPQTETKQVSSAWVKPRTGGWLNRG
jgi:phage terminase large subunit GpA-like protein